VYRRALAIDERFNDEGLAALRHDAVQARLAGYGDDLA
jgi:hypothetical protein